jgi:hypothetical protein
VAYVGNRHLSGEGLLRRSSLATKAVLEERSMMPVPIYDYTNTNEKWAIMIEMGNFWAPFGRRMVTVRSLLS